MWCGKYLPDAVYASAGNEVQRVLMMFARSDLFVVGCVVRSGETVALCVRWRVVLPEELQRKVA